MTLDTLRYDVAQDMLVQGHTPNLATLLPPSGWEKRHSPGSFTYAAHHAFFAGFLPTPATPGQHPRLFAARFPAAKRQRRPHLSSTRQISSPVWPIWAITPFVLAASVSSIKPARWVVSCRVCSAKVTGGPSWASPILIRPSIR